MYELKNFQNGPLQAEVRTLYIDGSVWFVLMDVARVFGYRDAGRVLHMLRKSQWVQADDAIRDALGVRGRAPYLVNESGFYRLASRSTRDEAQPFQEWVEDEVLPTLRRASDAGVDGIGELKRQVARAELEVARAKQDVEETRNAAHNNQVRTDREVKLQLDEMRKRVDFWGNAYMRMREEAGRICRENGVPESRLPIV